MNKSYWQKTSKHASFHPIKENKETDIVIIGGGLVGVSLAYQLKDSGLDVCLFEKDTLGSHTSGHTTAKVTTLHGLLYKDIVKHYDIHLAYLYYKSNEKAMNEIVDIIHKEHIDCDLIKNNSFIYTNDPLIQEDIEIQKNIFQSLRVPYIEDESYLSSMGLENQYIFHPLKYLYGLVNVCKDIHFYEHSIVTSVKREEESYVLKVNNYEVKCRYVIHATRYPFILRHMYFMKLFQQREYVDSIPDYHKDSVLSMGDTYSYRPVDKAGIEITGESHEWFAQDTTPLRGIPYIGRINKYHNEFIVTGFQKWGMTLSQVAAVLIHDLILEKENAYEELYSCHYYSMSFSSQYHKKMLSHLKKGYLTQRYQYKDVNEINNNEGAIVKIDHHLYALYKDDKGNEHYMSPYCPHLKCLVHFNHKSHTWDCPCHQSVYDVYGHLIEGPSLYSLKKESE